MAFHPDSFDPTSAPDFFFPLHDVVTPDSWPEWQQKGFAWLTNVPRERQHSDLFVDAAQTYLGVENVVTGYPLDRKRDAIVLSDSERGVYIREGH